MRLYMANTILTSVLLPLRCMDIVNNTQNDSNFATNTRSETLRMDDKMTGSRSGHKRQAAELGNTTEKKRPRNKYEETVATKAKRRRRQTAVTISNRTTGASTRLADNATANKTEETGNASRDGAELVQTAGPNLNSESIEFATTDPGTTETNTLHRMTARVRRPLEAVFSSLVQEQEEVRTTRYASEEPSKRRRLNGKDIDSPDAFEDTEAAAGAGVAATSGRDCSNRELPSVKDVL